MQMGFRAPPTSMRIAVFQWPRTGQSCPRRNVWLVRASFFSVHSVRSRTHWKTQPADRPENPLCRNISHRLDDRRRGLGRYCWRLNRGCYRPLRRSNLALICQWSRQGCSEAVRSPSLPVHFDGESREPDYGRPDLKDTIRRLEVFADAGADVPVCTGLKTGDEIDAVVRAGPPA